MSEEFEELKVITQEEVAKHTTNDDLWIVYNGKVYDVSSYIDEHPGGEEVIVDVGGGDATEAFDDIGHSDDAHEILKDLLIGRIEGGVVKEKTQTTDASSDGGLSLPLVGVVILLIALGVYYYLQNN